jgi:hypothetical protein
VAENPGRGSRPWTSTSSATSPSRSRRATSSCRARPARGRPTAARTVHRLLGRGLRVGVGARSHKAIHKLLEELEALAGGETLGLKKATDEDQSFYEGSVVANETAIEPFADPAIRLLAGTAWLFSREELDGALDVLVLDEAGQLSLADALAMGTSVRSLVLLGDPLQLAQVSQGTHPPGTGASVLEHLLADDPTIPEDRGVFVEETRRMHEDVCRFVSETVYAGRLRPAEACNRQGTGAGTGIRFLPVEHEGNQVQSEEKAKAIAAEIDRPRGVSMSRSPALAASPISSARRASWRPGRAPSRRCGSSTRSAGSSSSPRSRRRGTECLRIGRAADPASGQSRSERAGGTDARRSSRGDTDRSHPNRPPDVRQEGLRMATITTPATTTAPAPTVLERLIPAPRLLDVDAVDVAAGPERAWALVRHGDLGRSSLARALFAVRTLSGRLRGRPTEVGFRIDDIRSSADRPGFQVLADHPPHEVAVGAVGKVWQTEIPFVHVADADAFATFAEPGYVKVAWALRVLPWGGGARVELELRVDATDEESWRRFRRYFRLVGPASHFIRRSVLAAVARELGTSEAAEEMQPLPGDELLPDAGVQLTHGITIGAPPERIWPWLVQIGGGRAGFYSIDLLDNAGVRSAREVHSELQSIAVGDVLPATPSGEDGFEVLAVEEPRALVLGGLFDPDASRQLPFASPRPARFWHVTWAFALEPLGPDTTRLRVRARAAFPPSGRLHVAWIRPVHHLMQTVQLRHLAARAEGREPADDWRDVLEGLGGAAVMALGLATPFLRGRRNRWGLDEAAASRSLPGDELVQAPRWGWTHGVELDAPAEEVWPWIAQLGADRGGFYSYQWLENVAGCNLANAESVHPEWELREGDGLVLHPKQPPLRVVSVERGRHLVAYASPDEEARAAGKPWVAASWLFLVEPLGDGRSRLVSRYRAGCSDDLLTRLSFGPTLVEPIGFAMDRRMLLGVKERAERARAFS